MGDNRAASIERHLVTSSKSSDQQWLYLCGPDQAAQQILQVGQSACSLTDMTDERRSEYSHRIVWPSGVPPEVLQLVDVLKEVLTLRKVPYVDSAVVLDWYKVPDDEVDPMHWLNTAAGDLLSKGKYIQSATTTRLNARRELVKKMVDVFERHPLYGNTPAIVTVPGHKADESSFGERLAATVAKRLGKSVIETISRNGPRPERKAGAVEDLTNAFVMPQALSGDVVILDDVYSSGATMNAVALAARTAGAQRVFGIAAVKTMKN
jgi:adenine/guanine phosphoribosyltransferase-like PRPP-binding protein